VRSAPDFSLFLDFPLSSHRFGCFLEIFAPPPWRRSAFATFRLPRTARFTCGFLGGILSYLWRSGRSLIFAELTVLSDCLELFKEERRGPDPSAPRWVDSCFFDSPPHGNSLEVPFLPGWHSSQRPGSLPFNGFPDSILRFEVRIF